MVDPAPGGGVFLVLNELDREFEGGVRGRESTDLKTHIYVNNKAMRSAMGGELSVQVPEIQNVSMRI